MLEHPIEWGISVALSLAIGALALLLRRKTHSWTHPAVILALFWCFMTLGPILCVPELVASPFAMAFIFAVVLAFGLPAFFMDWRSAAAAAAARRGTTALTFSSRVLLYFFFALQVLALIFMAINLDRQGYPLVTLITDPLSVGCRYLGARYSGAVESNVFSQAGTVLNYIGAPLGGLVVSSRRGWALRLFVVILSFLPSLLNIYFYADKGTIFLTAAYFYGAVIVARTAAGNTELVTKGTIAVYTLAAAVLVPVIIVAMLNRGGGSCTEGNRTVQVFQTFGSIFQGAGGPGVETKEKPELASAQTGRLRYQLRSYAFGHLFAFSDWFDHKLSGTSTMAYVDPGFRTWGFWTFMAIGRFVLPEYYASLPAGYFDEYYIQENILGTNIYTMFRGLIYDFSVPGALGVMLVGGWIASLFYRRMLESEEASFAQAFYVFFWGFAYMSYGICLLIWNSVYAAAVGVLMVLLALRLSARWLDSRTGDENGERVEHSVIRHANSLP